MGVIPHTLVLWPRNQKIKWERFVVVVVVVIVSFSFLVLVASTFGRHPKGA